jgi:hypothetical protein
MDLTTDGMVGWSGGRSTRCSLGKLTDLSFMSNDLGQNDTYNRRDSQLEYINSSIVCLSSSNDIEN